MPRRVHAIFLAALAVGACGSGGAAGGAGGHSGAGGKGGRPDGAFVQVDGGPTPPGDEPDAALPLSCAGATDGGTVCVQFDPTYASPDTVCAAQGFGSVVAGACALEGSAGGCHVIEGPSGYTVWSYAPQTAGGEMFHCEQLGQSYVSATSDIESDAAATPANAPN